MKYLNLIRQRASVNKGGESRNIERGVRKGCHATSFICIIRRKSSGRNTAVGRYYRIGGYNVIILRYAENNVLVVDSEDKLQHMLNVLVRASEERPLNMNVRETETKVIAYKKQVPRVSLRNGNQRVRRRA